MTHLASFTIAERKLLGAWRELIEEGEREHLDKKAAMRLGIADATVRSRRSRMRTKYHTAMQFIREYRAEQQFFFQKTAGKFNPLSVSGRAAKK